MQIRLAPAGRFGFHSRERVTVGEGLSTRGAVDRVSQVAADVREHHGLVGIFFVLHRPELNGAIDVLQVADTGCLLSCAPGLHVVWNRDCREHPDDGHYNHDFDQGERSLC